jgi:hypothetical protein
MSADAAHAVRVPVRGFLQARQSKSCKWKTWLPKTSAPSWDWNPLRGGLCGNEEFESTSTEARSEGSGWLEIIMEGKLGKNNAGRLADAMQASAAHHSSGCSSDPHRVRTLARTNTLSSGPLHKRLVVLDIQFLLGHCHQCGREGRRQAPTKRTRLGVLSLCCIGTGAAAAAAGNGEFYD